VTGFYVRSGFWIDGLAVMTSLGRMSAVFGTSNGGSGLVVLNRFRLVLTGHFRHTLIPPRGYTIAGVTGSCGDWVDGFGIILTR